MNANFTPCDLDTAIRELSNNKIIIIELENAILISHTYKDVFQIFSYDRSCKLIKTGTRYRIPDAYHTFLRYTFGSKYNYFIYNGIFSSSNKNKIVDDFLGKPVSLNIFLLKVNTASFEPLCASDMLSDSTKKYIELFSEKVFSHPRFVNYPLEHGEVLRGELDMHNGEITVKSCYDHFIGSYKELWDFKMSILKRVKDEVSNNNQEDSCTFVFTEHFDMPRPSFVLCNYPEAMHALKTGKIILADYEGGYNFYKFFWKNNTYNCSRFDKQGNKRTDKISNIESDIQKEILYICAEPGSKVYSHNISDFNGKKILEEYIRTGESPVLFNISIDEYTIKVKDRKFFLSTETLNKAMDICFAVVSHFREKKKSCSFINKFEAFYDESSKLLVFASPIAKITGEVENLLSDIENLKLMIQRDLSTVI